MKKKKNVAEKTEETAGDEEFNDQNAVENVSVNSPFTYQQVTKSDFFYLDAY